MDVGDINVQSWKTVKIDETIKQIVFPWMNETIKEMEFPWMRT